MPCQTLHLHIYGFSTRIIVMTLFLSRVGDFTAQDMYTRIKAGALLVQLIIGMIYQSPQVIVEINEELVLLLQRDGYASIPMPLAWMDNLAYFAHRLQVPKYVV